nr:MAG TPA: hypothetical protein [Caudoviricetes sp.]
MLSKVKMQILLLGIQSKLTRGENLETVLKSYTKLTEEEKQLIRTTLN